MMQAIDIAMLQQNVHQLIANLGGYWEPFSTYARIAEELGELAEAITEKNTNKMVEECADLFIITTCLANQYQADLALGYKKNKMIKPASFNELAIVIGQIGRRLNHYEGIKKPKETEAFFTIEALIAQFHWVLFQFADAEQIHFIPAIQEKINFSVQRDKGRFNFSYDPALSPVTEMIIPFLKEKNLASRYQKLWCAAPWQNELDIQQNMEQHFLKQLKRFCKIAPFEGLHALALMMPEKYGSSPEQFNSTLHTLTEIINLHDKKLFLNYYAPCFTGEYFFSDATVILFTLEDN